MTEQRNDSSNESSSVNGAENAAGSASKSRKSRGEIWFKIVTGLLALVLIGAIVYQSMPKSEKSTMKDHGPAYNFELTDTNGKPVKLSDSDGKVRLVYFFYTNCPDVCSPTTFLMSGVQEMLKEKNAYGTKTQFYSITIDPARDTPEVLKNFYTNPTFKMDPAGWSFLYGTEAYTQQLTEKYQIVSLKDKDGNYTHSNIIFLLDKKGHIRYYYNGSDIELTKAKIADDMLQLAGEK